MWNTTPSGRRIRSTAFRLCSLRRRAVNSSGTCPWSISMETKPTVSSTSSSSTRRRITCAWGGIATNTCVPKMAGASGGAPPRSCASTAATTPGASTIRSPTSRKGPRESGRDRSPGRPLGRRRRGSGALSRAVDNGWIDGPRIVPAGHAITPTGGHLDPTMFQRFAPDVLPLRVEEGIANGVPEVRKAVRYQIKYGARLIKISASGGVMSHSGLAGAQQYSDEELNAIADEAHRAGIKVAAHAHGDAGIRACIRAGIDCIEHGSLASDETIQLMVEHDTFL